MLPLFKNILHVIYFTYVCLWFIGLIVLAFPFALLLLLFPKKIQDAVMFFILKLISNIWLIVTGMLPINYNRSKINFKHSYIIMPNHQAFLDAAIIYTSLLKPFKTLGKIEIKKAPIYGLIYKMVVITVDRSSVAAKANSFRKMKKELEDGISVGIFPEGTFANTPQQELLPFQNGGFALALLQQVDILPVLFLDASTRMHPSKLWKVTPGLNRAVFLPPIKMNGIDKRQTDALKDYSYQYMNACLQFCRNQNVKDVWNFATDWQKNNSLVL